MGLIHLDKAYGLTIRESANDGSDFTNPDADYRRLFLGEDGILHLKDSAGTVTDIGGGGIPDTIVDAKGDLIAGTAADTVDRLAAGANDTILMADSGQTTGLKWVASQTPTTQDYDDVAAQGTADTYARGDHLHGMPSAGGGGGGQATGAYATAVLATADLEGYWRGYDTFDSGPNEWGGAFYTTTAAFAGARCGPSLLPGESASRSFLFASGGVFQAPHNGTGLDVGDVYTLMAVIRPTSVSGVQSIMSKGTGGFYLRQNGTNLNLLRSNTADMVSSTGVTLAINTVYHVAATKNGSTIKLYIDGVDVTGSVSNSTNTDNTSPFIIGGDTGTASGYNGKITEVAVFSRALSAVEIGDLFTESGL